MKNLFLKTITIFLLIPQLGCSVLGKKGTWGKNAFWHIKGERILTAFKLNIASPHVWAPLTGAAVIHVGGYDKKISNWVLDENHIFENQEAADNWSDNFSTILKVSLVSSTALTPSMGSDDSLREYAINKSKGVAVVVVSHSSARYIHDRIQSKVIQERPNGANNKSFPSTHATKAASYSTLSSKNLHFIEMDPNLKLGLHGLNTAMAATVSWARIEGNRHYPTDVLVGYSMGAFFSGFMYNVLMNSDPGQYFVLAPARDMLTAQYIISLD